MGGLRNANGDPRGSGGKVGSSGIGGRQMTEVTKVT